MTAPEKGFPVLASACLCGFACRYDGKPAAHPFMEHLYAQGLAIPVCPEELGGLPTPRSPYERRGNTVVDASGADVTEAFTRGAAKTLALAKEHGVSTAVLKDRSPSCGTTVVHDGSFTGTVMPGKGFAAEFLEANGIAVTDPDSFAAEAGAA